MITASPNLAVLEIDLPRTEDRGPDVDLLLPEGVLTLSNLRGLTLAGLDRNTVAIILSHFLMPRCSFFHLTVSFNFEHTSSTFALTRPNFDLVFKRRMAGAAVVDILMEDDVFSLDADDVLRITFEEVSCVDVFLWMVDWIAIAPTTSRIHIIIGEAYTPETGSAFISSLAKLPAVYTLEVRGPGWAVPLMESLRDPMPSIRATEWLCPQLQRLRFEEVDYTLKNVLALVEGRYNKDYKPTAESGVENPARFKWLVVMPTGEPDQEETAEAIKAIVGSDVLGTPWDESDSDIDHMDEDENEDAARHSPVAA